MISEAISNERWFIPQVLVEIFCRIDSPKALLCSCSLVCRHWAEVLSTRYFWIAYLKRNYNFELPLEFRGNKALNLKRLAVYRCFNRNLIENSSGEKGFTGWQITNDGGDRFLIERPPVGCHDPPDVEIKCAFATSFSPSMKHTVIDLRNIGEAFLDQYRPPIEVSEYFTARFDCGCMYFLNVKLLTSKELKRRTGTEMNWLRLPFGSLDDTTTEKSIFRIRHIQQWSDATWRKIEHTFTNYPPGIRYVFFEHGGVDVQFWRGHYGSKMAKASVIVRLV